LPAGRGKFISFQVVFQVAATPPYPSARTGIFDARTPSPLIAALTENSTLRFGPGNEEICQQ
jgi:hypothetical protein